MGKSYLFECTKCGYRVALAGGPAEGHDLKVQTIHCRDCRTLHDCVVELRSNTVPALWKNLDLLPEDLRPNLKVALNRLPPSPSEPREWTAFDPVCPTNETHRVEPWNTPGRCPKCKSFLERGALPYRLWD